MILIHKIGDAFAVKSGETEIGRWNDVRKAKAARGAIQTAIDAGTNPAMAVFIGLQAASDAALCAGYNDAEDETFAK
jgi:hypothetical protein